MATLTAQQLKQFQKWLNSINNGVQSIQYSGNLRGGFEGFVFLVEEMGEIADVFIKHEVGGQFS